MQKSIPRARKQMKFFCPIHLQKFQRHDRPRTDHKIHRNNRNTFNKSMKNQNADKTRFTQRHNEINPKITTPPGNQYDLPPTRAEAQIETRISAPIEPLYTTTVARPQQAQNPCIQPPSRAPRILVSGHHLPRTPPQAKNPYDKLLTRGKHT